MRIPLQFAAKEKSLEVYQLLRSNVGLFYFIFLTNPTLKKRIRIGERFGEEWLIPVQKIF